MTKVINTPIRFISKNYLNNNCQIDYFDDKEFVFTKLCDYDPFKTDNALIESTSLSFDVWFKDDYGEFCTRKINCIILQNCNLKSFTVKTLIDEVETILYQVSNNTQTNLILYFNNEVELSKISFDITEVFSSSTAIKIGQLRLCTNILQLSATTQTEVSPIVDEGSLRTYNGRLVNWTNFEKWGARIQINNISKTQLDIIKNLIKKDSYITIIPWETWEANDIYEVQITRGQIGTYAVNRWSGLISQTLNVEAKENAYN